MKIGIAGWGHTRFGRHQHLALEDLIVSAGREALLHAELDPSDVDAIYVAHLNGGFVRDSFVSSLALQIDDRLRFTPSTRVENACASGGAAIFQALNDIEARRARNVLVIGAEKMTEVSGSDVTEILAGATYVREEASHGVTFAGLFGDVATQYFQTFGDKSRALAGVASKNHCNGALNPLAHFQKPLTEEQCHEVGPSNPLVAGPLRRTDCSAVSDGAAALVLSGEDAAPRRLRARFLARAHVNDYLPMSRRNVTRFEGPRLAWARALAQARLSVWDLCFAEVHDCFTIAELLAYEAMGLAPYGAADRLVNDGVTRRDGRFPVNPSGGLKAKGHPVGATGVSMHVMAAMQLAHVANDFQVKADGVAGVFNMGGSAVANYVSLLSAV